MILECRVERKMATDDVDEEIYETKRRSFTYAFNNNNNNNNIFPVHYHALVT